MQLPHLVKFLFKFNDFFFFYRRLFKSILENLKTKLINLKYEGLNTSTPKISGTKKYFFQLLLLLEDTNEIIDDK